MSRILKNNRFQAKITKSTQIGLSLLINLVKKFGDKLYS